VGVVLILAAAGKGLDGPRSWAFALTAFEAVLGVLLVVGLFPFAVGMLALMTTTGFLLHALRKGVTSCKCFGNALPATSRVGQVARNGLMTAGCSLLVYLQTENLESVTTPRSPTIGLALGAVIGAAVVVLPWILSWSLGGLDA
jgi:uncharacterized membrane protein YphA (DoxX/SURF4 family)